MLPIFNSEKNWAFEHNIRNRESLFIFSFLISGWELEIEENPHNSLSLSK